MRKEASVIMMLVFATPLGLPVDVLFIVIELSPEPENVSDHAPGWGTEVPDDLTVVTEEDWSKDETEAPDLEPFVVDDDEDSEAETEENSEVEVEVWTSFC